MAPFSWISVNCLKAAEPLSGNSLIFTTKSPGYPGTQLLIWSTSEGWMAESTLELPNGFEAETPGLGTQYPNH